MTRPSRHAPNVRYFVSTTHFGKHRMNRSIFLAALATLASTAAVAQSSITVYGRLNETVERQKAEDVSVWRLQNNASRIGFKGTEDLGGGLSAGFQIEHGFDADTGSGN